MCVLEDNTLYYRALQRKKRSSMNPPMKLTRNSAAFLIGIPVQIFIDQYHKLERRLAAEEEARAVTSTPSSGANAEKGLQNTKETDGQAAAASKPALEAKSPEITQISNRREWSETKDGAMDDANESSVTSPPRSATNPKATNEPGIYDPTALRREPEQLSSSSPLSHGVAASAVAHLPTAQRPKSKATSKIKPQSEHAGPRSRSNIPSEDRHRAERSLDGCSCWARIKRRLEERERQEVQESHRNMPEPEKPSGPKLLTPWAPRPRYERTGASMARPWGLKQPSGLQV